MQCADARHYSLNIINPDMISCLSLSCRIQSSLFTLLHSCCCYRESSRSYWQWIFCKEYRWALRFFLNIKSENFKLIERNQSLIMKLTKKILRLINPLTRRTQIYPRWAFPCAQNFHLISLSGADCMMDFIYIRQCLDNHPGEGVVVLLLQKALCVEWRLLPARPGRKNTFSRFRRCLHKIRPFFWTHTRFRCSHVSRRLLLKLNNGCVWTKPTAGGWCSPARQDETQWKDNIAK